MQVKYLFLVPLGWAIVWSVSKMVAANNVLRKVATGASRRGRGRPRPDPKEEAYRRAVAALLGELQALERITPAQAETWGSLPLERLEEQLLLRGVITREQWDQLWTRLVLPALKAAEPPPVTLDTELQDALRTRK